MKQITLLVAIVGMMMLQSCTVNDVPQPAQVVNNYDNVNEVFEVTRSFTPSNGFSNLVSFPHTIYPADMVLVYRLSGVYQGTDVWKLQPETFYFDDGTLDFGYNFDFTRYDVSLYMHGNNLATVSNQYRYNQVFRIVLLPGYLSNKVNPKIDFKDYNATLKACNLDKAKIEKLD